MNILLSMPANVNTWWTLVRVFQGAHMLGNCLWTGNQIDPSEQPEQVQSVSPPPASLYTRYFCSFTSTASKVANHPYWTDGEFAIDDAEEDEVLGIRGKYPTRSDFDQLAIVEHQGGFDYAVAAHCV